MPAARQIEVPIVVDALEEAAAVDAHDVDLDADLRERLLDEGREQRNILAPGRRRQAQREAHAVRALFVAGFVQQLFGERFVEGILRPLIGGEEILRDGRNRAGAALGEVAEKILDKEGDVERMGDGAPHANVRQPCDGN